MRKPFKEECSSLGFLCQKGEVALVRTLWVPICVILFLCELAFPANAKCIKVVIRSLVNASSYNIANVICYFC